MADEAAGGISRDALIAEIAGILEEIKQLGVHLHVNAELRKIQKLPGELLLEEIDCRREQLTRRKKFMGVK